MTICKEAIERYVRTLDEQVQKLYYKAEELAMSWADTLDDEFQIADEITRVFEGRAHRWYDIHWEERDDP